MNTASAIKLGVALGAATTVTALSPLTLTGLAQTQPAPAANVRPHSATIPGSSITAFYDALSMVKSDIDKLAVATENADPLTELDLVDVYVDLDADLPPRNTERWRPVEVTLVRTERRRGSYSTDDEAWQ